MSIPIGVADDEILCSVVEIGVAAAESVVVATGSWRPVLGLRMVEGTASDSLCDGCERIFGFGDAFRCDGVCGRDGGRRELSLSARQLWEIQSWSGSLSVSRQWGPASRSGRCRSLTWWWWW